MLVKTFWLSVYLAICSASSQYHYYQMTYNFSKKQLCYVGLPTCSFLVFIFFTYRYINKKFENFNPLNKECVESMISWEKDSETRLVMQTLKEKPLELQQAILKQLMIINQEEQIKNKTKLFYKKSFKECVIYPMSYISESGYCLPEGLIYAANLGKQILVKQVSDAANQDIISKSGDRCFFDTQFWVDCETKCVRISQDTTAINHKVSCALPDRVVIDNTITCTGSSWLDGAQIKMPNDFREYFIVDGPNENNTVVIGVFSQDEKASALYKIEKIENKTQEIKMLFMFDGLLCALMMHPNKNIIAF